MSCLPCVSITADLPPDRVLRTVREDLRSESVLFLGAEIGLFYTMDGGGHWTELRRGMLTVAGTNRRVYTMCD